MSFQSTTAVPLSDILDRLEERRIARMRRIQADAAYRHVTEQLTALSDRDLIDIGVSRGDIAEIAGAAARECLA